MILSLEGRMGSGKSLSSAILAYTEWFKREVLITALRCVLEGMAWEESVKEITSEHEVGPGVAGRMINQALQIYQEEGEEAYRESKTVYSNNHLNFPYKQFDPQFFLEHIEDNELEDCILLLDEAYLYLDSRSTATKMNKLFTYFVAQTRKRGVDLYICTHHIDVLDKRLRRALDVRGTCRYNKGPMEEDKVVSKRRYNWVRVTFRDLRTGGERRIRMYGPVFFFLYDTYERVPLFRKQMEIEL